MAILIICKMHRERSTPYSTEAIAHVQPSNPLLHPLLRILQPVSNPTSMFLDLLSKLGIHIPRPKAQIRHIHGIDDFLICWRSVGTPNCNDATGELAAHGVANLTAGSHEVARVEAERVEGFGHVFYCYSWVLSAVLGEREEVDDEFDG